MHHYYQGQFQRYFWDRLESETWYPLLQWLHLKKHLLKQRNTKMGWGIAARLHSWGKLWTKSYKKTKNPMAISEEPGTKAGYITHPRVHHTPCVPDTTKGVGEKEGNRVKSFSHVWLFATPWTVAHQAPPSMGFSRQEYWSGVPFPSLGDLPNPGIEPGSPTL